MNSLGLVVMFLGGLVIYWAISSRGAGSTQDDTTDNEGPRELAPPRELQPQPDYIG